MFGKGRPKISFRRPGSSSVNNGSLPPKGNPPAIVIPSSAQQNDSKSKTIRSNRFRPKGFKKKSPRNLVGNFRRLTPRSNRDNKLATPSKPSTSEPGKVLLSPMGEKKLRMFPKIAGYRAKGYITDLEERQLYLQLERNGSNPFDTSVLTEVENKLEAFKAKSRKNIRSDDNGEKFIEKALKQGQVEDSQDAEKGEETSRDGSKKNVTKSNLGNGNTIKTKGKGQSRNIIDELMHLQRVAAGQRSYSMDSSKADGSTSKSSSLSGKINQQKEQNPSMGRAKETIKGDGSTLQSSLSDKINPQEEQNQSVGRVKEMRKRDGNTFNSSSLSDKINPQKEQNQSVGRAKETRKENINKSVVEPNMFTHKLKGSKGEILEDRKPLDEVKQELVRKSYSMDAEIGDTVNVRKPNLPYSELPLNDRVIIEARDIFNQADEDFVENLFVEMCFFARLGFVQPPSCLHCAHQEGIKGHEPNFKCKSFIIWRNDATKLLHPDLLDHNLRLIECQAVRTLLDGEIVQDHYWDRTKKQLIQL